MILCLFNRIGPSGLPLHSGAHSVFETSGMFLSLPVTLRCIEDTPAPSASEPTGARKCAVRLRNTLGLPLHCGVPYGTPESSETTRFLRALLHPRHVCLRMHQIDAPEPSASVPAGHDSANIVKLRTFDASKMPPVLSSPGVSETLADLSALLRLRGRYLEDTPVFAEALLGKPLPERPRHFVET